MKQIEEHIKNLIIKKTALEKEQLMLEADLVSDLGIDSIECIELILSIETEFHISFPDEDMRSMRTVGDIISRTAALVDAR
ncbi:acyl carrier protein [Ktedonosporobacter rubrisoli]|uniref:Acyl carrier protein n=1 Tax=Ktedonosporobacter rubrisoli TaxID=2509675 RepID=A0A4P6JP96_KTERU|nr:acyl carrier protein [Ktedonosporobacter rubrisoli]QBD77199.1 acyl carrier protein [Ktedonosporobacter rubrisoli]